jgi:hypothetical protein
MFKGAVVFLATGNFISNMILFFRRLPHPDARFSHCCRCIGPLTQAIIDKCQELKIKILNPVLGEEYVVSMEPSGCTLMTLAKQIANKKLVSIWMPDLDESKTDAMIMDELSKVNDVYAYGQIIGMIRVTIADWMHITIKNPYTKNEFCSENVHQSLVGPFGDGNPESECSKELKTFDKDSIAPDEVFAAMIKDPKSVELKVPV